MSRVEGVEGTFDSPLTERKIPRLYPISQRGPITVAVGTFSSTSRTLLPELDENNRDISSDTPAGPSMPRQTRPRGVPAEVDLYSDFLRCHLCNVPSPCWIRVAIIRSHTLKAIDPIIYETDRSRHESNLTEPELG